MHCTNLEYIDLPYTLTEIGENAFSDTRITSLDLSKFYRLTKLDYGCFSDCYKLKDFKFPPNLIYLGDCSFSNCNLLYVNLPFSLLNFNINCFDCFNSINCVKIYCNSKCKIKGHIKGKKIKFYKIKSFN